MKRLSPPGFLALLALVLFLAPAARAADYNYLAPEAAKERMAKDPSLFILDIQPGEDFAKGHLDGATSTTAYPVKSDADRAKLDALMPSLKEKTGDVLIVCPAGGGGATRTFDYLEKEGIARERLLILEGGQKGWPFETKMGN